MNIEDVLLAELTRHAVLVGKMEATLQAISQVLQSQMIEPNRWYALSMVNRCLDDIKHVQTAKALPMPAISRPNGEDKSQGALALPAPVSKTARRQALIERAASGVTKALRLPG